MGEAGGGEEKGRRFSPSALSLFRFHLSPFPPETPDTQASSQFDVNVMLNLSNTKDSMQELAQLTTTACEIGCQVFCNNNLIGS